MFEHCMNVLYRWLVRWLHWTRIRIRLSDGWLQRSRLLEFALCQPLRTGTSAHGCLAPSLVVERLAGGSVMSGSVSRFQGCSTVGTGNRHFAAAIQSGASGPAHH